MFIQKGKRFLVHKEEIYEFFRLFISFRPYPVSIRFRKNFQQSLNSRQTVKIFINKLLTSVINVFLRNSNTRSLSPQNFDYLTI